MSNKFFDNFFLVFMYGQKKILNTFNLFFKKGNYFLLLIINNNFNQIIYNFNNNNIIILCKIIYNFIKSLVLTIFC